MIATQLQDIQIPLHDFLNELDKKQLIFLSYCTEPDEYDVEDIGEGTDNIELFIQAAKKEFRINQIPKEDVIEAIIEDFNGENLENIPLDQVYISASGGMAYQSIESIVRLMRAIFANNLKRVIKNSVEIELLNKFFSESKYVFNSVGLTVLLGVLEKKDQEDEEDIMPVKMEVLARIMKNYHLYRVKEAARFQREKRDIAIKLNKAESNVENEKRKSLKLKESLSKLQKEKKQILKDCTTLKSTSKGNKQESQLIAQLRAELKEKDCQAQKLNEKLNKNPIPAGGKLIETLNNRIMELREDNDRKKYEIRTLKQELKQIQAKSVSDIVAGYLKENGMDQALYNVITPYYYNEFSAQAGQEVVAKQTLPAKQIQIIGYCSIENNKHYVILPNGRKEEILGIPKSTYIGEGQFVLVDSQFSLTWVYSFGHEPGPFDYSISSFGTVQYRDDKAFINKGDGSLEEIKEISEGINLRPEQLIAVDGKNNYLRFYKPIRHNADDFLDSVKAKGQQMAFVLKIFPNGAYLRDIETGEEFISSQIRGKETLQEQEVLCLEGDKVVKIFRSYKVYTLSSFYKRMVCGTVEIENEVVFARKVSGERIIVNNIPAGLELRSGDIVNIDENNNFSGFQSHTAPKILAPVSRRPKNSTKKNHGYGKIQISKKIAIIGNKAYENSYKLLFYKNGYKVEVVEGYESWPKVSAAIKDVDLIVVITSYISHANMWQLKKEADARVVYSEHDGANKILQLVEENLRMPKKSLHNNT